MAIQNAIASVAVRDLKAAEQWYEKLFGRPADSHPMPELREWKFERGGWLQVYQLAERAGSGSFTLAVDNLDEEVHKLRTMGVDTSQRSDGPAVKTLMITDPDGNHIAFAEAIDTTLAR
jgi:predicted enzyme related to lactoylglutathione lyase